MYRTSSPRRCAAPRFSAAWWRAAASLLLLEEVRHSGPATASLDAESAPPMDTTNLEPRPALCPKTYIAANGCAVVAATVAAILVPRELRHVYPTHLVWAPVLAFVAAAFSCTKLLAPWMSFIALGLNLAALVLFLLAAYVSVADANVAGFALAYALLGMAVAGWDLRHICTALSMD